MLVDEQSCQVSDGEAHSVALHPNVEVKDVSSHVVAF